MSTGFLNAKGEIQQVDLNVGMYRDAAKMGMSLPQYINSQYPTNSEKYGATFQQMMAAEGIFLKTNRELGIRASTMSEIFDGPTGPQAAVITKDGVPSSRILYPAVFLQAIEDKLQANYTMTADAFETMIGSDESINGDRYEQPQINFDRPAMARHQGIAQLAKPPSMVLITTADKAYRIPTFSLGMEISDQAAKATTIDVVALSLARQASVERNERAQNYMTALLNGDPDNNDQSLATLGYVKASTVYDPTITPGGFTQVAWMNYLVDNGTKRTITHIVTDLKTAMRLENRSGKPTLFTDNPNSVRIDTTFNLMNPTWAKNPNIFLTQDPNWPAGTLMGFDKSFAIRRVRNISADYQGVESFVMRRSQQMRFDFGEHVNRLYPDAFGCMTI